jgi:hypothetical protein
MTGYPRGRRRQPVCRAPWLDNPADKVGVREHLIGEAGRRGISVRSILTLPGQTAHCVQAFHAGFPAASIIGLERNAIIFDSLRAWQRQAGLPGVEVHHMTLERWIERTTGRVDLGFLDFTSYPQESLLRTTARFLDHRLARPGICGIVYSLHPRVDPRVRATTGAFFQHHTGDPDPTPAGIAAVLQRLLSRPVTITRAAAAARGMVFLSVASHPESGV